MPGPGPDAAYPSQSTPPHAGPIALQAVTVTVLLGAYPTLTLPLRLPLPLPLTQAVTVTALLGAAIAFQFFVLANL